ncbi:MAG: TonB-dependent receptor [Paludibacteraceae bacterium]|nr:TonB-dependent receptor [Paludibacteraceae bacterium]
MKNRKSSIMKGAISVLLLALSTVAVYAQSKTITGRVIDELGEGVISATVMVKGTSTGTVTDFDGNFTLSVPADAKVLTFSYVGYKTQELPVSSSMNVKLVPENQQLQEVVVTGYGTTKKRDLVTSVASVSAEQLKDVPVTTAAEALQGKLSGVSVTTTEGSPDADIKVRVRGGTSLTQSSEPLYIVDGFPVSSISDIAPTDIASMDVLKDAAATAIYGAQGANGVIIITTKDSNADGDNTVIHVDYSGYVGWKKMAKKYDMLDARDFALMQYEYAYLNKGEKNLPSNFNTYLDPIYAGLMPYSNGVIYYHDSDFTMGINDILDYWGAQPYTDWQDETFGRTGFNSNHSVAVSGGSKVASFHLSYNRIDDESIMYGSDYHRNNLSLKAKFKPIKDLTLGFTARYTNTKVHGSGTNTSEDPGSKSESRVRNAIAYTPVELFSKDDDSKLDDEDSFGSLYDPITTIDHNYKEKLDNKWTMNGYASYKFLKKFTVKTELTYESRNVRQNFFYGPTSYYSRAGDGYTGAGGVYNTSSVITKDDQTSKFRNVNTLEYRTKFGADHNFNVLVGEETIVNKGELKTFYGYGYDKTYTGEKVFNYLSQYTKANYKNYIDPTDNTLSFFARANYDFRGRYYLTATMRADGSTRFDKSHRWGYFPSVAAAWRMSDEDWMANASEWLSNLKLRLSYGTAGNNNVDLGYLHYEYTSSPVTNSAYGGTVWTLGGENSNILANPDLKWETTITRDFGVDYGFFNERLSGAVDIYWNNTRDLLLLYKLSTGQQQFRNIGSTENKGIEFSVKGVILDKRTDNLNYGLSVDANISFNRNKVVDLGGMADYQVQTQCFSANYNNLDYEFRLTEGSPVGDVYGYRTDGWYTASDFASYNASTNEWLDANGNPISTILGNARPGMMRIKDTDGNGTVNAADRVVLGNTLPKASGGFTIAAFVGSKTWGKVDLNANFTYSIGNDVVNLSALDYSTIFDKSKLRNNTSDIAYGKRYSLFRSDGSFIPSSYYETKPNPEKPSETITVVESQYSDLVSALDAANAGASIYNPVMNNIALTDRVVEDASYLRLSSLTIGYSLPDNWLKKAHIAQARLFFTASNLFCITKYSGSDPEVDTRSKLNPLAVGVDFSAFPKSRAFNVGLNLSF